MADFPVHPAGETVKIVSIEAGNRGRSCEEHEVCGTVVDDDIVVRLRHVQIEIDRAEKTAVACYWITDGVDRCRVGFLPRHCVPRAHYYDGRLAQVVDIYSRHRDSPSKRRKVYCMITIKGARKRFAGKIRHSGGP